MTIITCTQNDILPDECPECGGWLHDERRGGVPGPFEWWFCSEDCAASCQDHATAGDRVAHLHVRDLMCDCEVCTAAGHPTDAEKAEWAAHQAQTALCACTAPIPGELPGWCDNGHWNIQQVAP